MYYTTFFSIIEIILNNSNDDYKADTKTSFIVINLCFIHLKFVPIVNSSNFKQKRIIMCHIIKTKQHLQHTPLNF